MFDRVMIAFLAGLFLRHGLACSVKQAVMMARDLLDATVQTEEEGLCEKCTRDNEEMF